MRMHLALIGYRACGKTTLGRVLGDRLQYPCIDVDRELEEGEGRTIADMFATDGEHHFRNLEHRYLQTFCSRSEPLILSTGGGCVLRADNRKLLTDSCTMIVYMEASAALLTARLQRNAGGRPSLSGSSVDQEVARILGQRRALYEGLATHRVQASESPQALLQELLSMWKTFQ